MTLPVFRAKSSADFGSGSSGSIAVPAGTASGDAVVGEITADGSGLTLSFSGGATWTHETALSITNGDAQTSRLATKIAGGSEGANYTWNNSGGNNLTVGVASYSGVDAALLDVAVVANNPNSASPPASPISAVCSSVTTVTNDAMVLMWFVVDNNGGVAGTWGAPAGTTARITQNPAQFSNMLMVEFGQTTAGATGSKTATYTSAGISGNFSGYTVAIRPAGAGGSSAALTGNAGTSAVGILSPAANKALSGNVGTAAVGTLGTIQSLGLSGNAGAGSVGSLGVAASKALVGNAGTGAAGAVSPAASIAMAGNAGTGAAGALTAAVSVQLSGGAGTGAVGTLTPNSAGSVSLTGNAGTGAVGALSPSVDTALDGNAGAGADGSLAPSIGAAITGNAAIGAVGAIAASASVALAGNQSQGSAGVMSLGGDVTVQLVGVSANGYAGSLSIQQAESAFSGGYLVNTASERRRLKREEEAAHARVEQGMGAVNLPAPSEAPDQRRIAGTITRRQLIGQVSLNTDSSPEIDAIARRQKRRREEEELLLM